MNLGKQTQNMSGHDLGKTNAKWLGCIESIFHKENALVPPSPILLAPAELRQSFSCSMLSEVCHSNCVSLFSYESKNKELHPVHRGVTPTSPLSSPACQLLKEFQLRYGIGLLYCKISYLDYLVK